jgi:hypothetical protein
MNIRMTFQVNEDQRRAIGRMMGHRRGKHPVTRAEFTQWLTEIYINSLDKIVKEHDRRCELETHGEDQLKLFGANATEPVKAEGT